MKQKFHQKNILILGLGKSGKEVISVLQKLNANIFYYDDNREKTKKLSNYYGKIYTPLYEISKKTIKDIELVVVSPGIPIDSPHIKLLKKYSKQIIGEVELFYKLTKKKIIAVTGSNGKTTTVNIIHHIFNLANISNQMLGNIGTPLISNYNDKNTKKIIAEISSFQLETVKDFRPKISVITNITPNHLDRHKSMKNYINEKSKIFTRQTKKDYCVLNYDDKNTKKMSPPCKTLYFSLTKIVKGAFIFNNYFCYKKYKKIHKICPVTFTKLIGSHNIQNILCAVVIAKICKIKNSVITNAIKSFEPIKHRMQFVREINGVKFYNDSKSTSPDATVTALKCFKKNVYLILGGKDKNCSFDEIFKNDKKIVLEYLFVGENREKLINSAVKNNKLNFKIFSSIIEATNYAYLKSKPESIVLLSPASSSFDQFNNFEERGECFINTVGELAYENYSKI